MKTSTAAGLLCALLYIVQVGCEPNEVLSYTGVPAGAEDDARLPLAEPAPSVSCSKPIKLKGGFACACSGPSCDSVESLGNLDVDEVVVFESSRQGKRLARSTLKFEKTKGPGWHSVELSPEDKFQTIVGFGGAFTDAAAVNLFSLSPETRDNLLKSYYDKDTGIGYSLGRIPMASCDFSTHTYSYDDHEGDYNMEKFSIDVDKEQKLPMIKRALELSGGLSLFASPWSPPAWLKDNKKVVSGHVAGFPGGPEHKAWALYFSKFLEAYEREGVKIWGVTIQNEPGGAPFVGESWDSCLFNATHEREFLKMDLGPQLAKTHPNVKIMVMDDQRRYLPKHLDTIMADPEAAKYVAGVAVHWYTAVEDTLNEFKNLVKTNAKYPGVFILPSEACLGYIPVLSRGPSPGSWHRGQIYGYDILWDLESHSVGWTDWNIALSMTGGPNWAKNFVDAPILVDADNDVFYKQPMYYYLAHFAKFIPPGSIRIKTTRGGPFPVESTSFLRPDGAIAVVVMNRDYLLSRSIYIHHPTRGYINANIPPASIQTYVFKQ